MNYLCRDTNFIVHARGEKRETSPFLFA